VRFPELFRIACMPRRNPNTPPDVRFERRVNYLPEGYRRIEEKMARLEERARAERVLGLVQAVARAAAKRQRLQDEARALGLTDLVQERTAA
jgi:hypothetical protein